MGEGGQNILEIKDINIYLNKSWIDFWEGEDYKKADLAIVQSFYFQRYGKPIHIKIISIKK